MQGIGIIPARYASSRFPGKLLADQTGKPLLQHVFERAADASRIERVLIATDDDRIAAAGARFGAEVVMTRADHQNGTSRIGEVVERLAGSGTDVEHSIIVNIQGDEPDIDPAVIDRAFDCLADHPDAPVATIASPFAAGEDPHDPNIVKVVLGADGCALYFSRAVIPHTAGRTESATTGSWSYPLKHVGLYAYRPSFLRTYVQLSATPLERAERLEQLRVLEHGYRIAVAVAEAHHHGIDTPRQYAAFVRRQAGS